jgi:hypothetical protein
MSFAEDRSAAVVLVWQLGTRAISSVFNSSATLRLFITSRFRSRFVRHNPVVAHTKARSLAVGNLGVHKHCRGWSIGIKLPVARH